MKNLLIVLFVVLSSSLLQAAHFGAGFQTMFANENMHFAMNKHTGEKIAVTQSELILPRAEIEKFYDQRELQNDLALPFGFLTKSVQTAKNNKNGTLEMTFNVYSYSPYTESETVTYQKVIVNNNQLVTIDYYPGGSGRSAEQMFNKVPQNLFISKAKKFSKISLLFTPAMAAAPDCAPTSAGLTNQITNILNSVKIDCSKPEYQKPGTLSDIRNVLSGCVSGLAIGGLEMIKFVVDSFDFLVKVAQSDSYRQEIKSSLGQVALITQVDPRAAAMSAMKMAVTGLTEAAGNFRSCGLQYQAVQVCQVVAMLIPPAAIAAAVFRKVAAKTAAKVAAEKAVEKTVIKKVVAKKHMQEVFTEAAEATDADWDEAVKAFKGKQKAEADKLAAEAAAKEAAKDARRKALEANKAQAQDSAEYLDPDSDLAKEYEKYFAEQKVKAKQAADALVKQRQLEAAEREAARLADRQARMNGSFPGKDVFETPATQVPDGMSKEAYMRKIREENEQLIKELGLDK